MKVFASWLGLGLLVLRFDSCSPIGETFSSGNILAGLNPFRGRFSSCMEKQNFVKGTVELIEKLGYPVETHTVTTDDGYILIIHRIPHGKNQKQLTEAKPILLLHGLPSSSADFVVNAANQSIGFTLADAGYDVWLGNFRGTTYSRRHIKLDPDQTTFWNFTIDEIAIHDIPAFIDYILHMTGHTQLEVVGHSMATSALLALLSSKVDFNDKITNFFALAPTVYLGHMRTPLMDIFDLLYIVEQLCACDRIRPICTDVVSLLYGRNSKEINETCMSIYLHHFPAGSSLYVARHMSLNRKVQRLQHYDWGKGTPSAYDLQKVKVRTHFIYGQNDVMITPSDIRKIEKLLPNLIGDHVMDDPDWGHMDFIWGRNAGRLVTDIITGNHDQR